MRWLAALGLVLAGVGAWQLRENGILLGRDEDGPLRLGHGTGSVVIKPGQLPQMEDVAQVKGEPVELESALPALKSPGLEFFGPVAGKAGEDGPCVGCIGPWPPAGSSKLERIADEDVVVTGFRAREPGIYHLHGVRYRYRRGARRFAEVDRTQMCFFVTRDLDQRGCDLDRQLRGFEGVAEIGGPADYLDGRFPRWKDTSAHQGPVYRMRPGGTLEFVITLSNLSGEDARVPRLDLGLGGDYKDQLDPLPPDPPTPFTISGHGSRKVRVRARYAHCDLYSQAQSRTFDTIEAGDDDVELSVPVTVTGPCR